MRRRLRYYRADAQSQIEDAIAYCGKVMGLLGSAAVMMDDRVVAPLVDASLDNSYSGLEVDQQTAKALADEIGNLMAEIKDLQDNILQTMRSRRR